MPVLAVQGYSAGRGVVQRPHGDGAGADQGGRGRALQGRLGVRSCGCILVSVGVPPCSGRSALFWLCSNTALHAASLNGKTEMAVALVKAGADVHCKTNDGYRLGAATSCRSFVRVRSGRCVLRVGAAGVAVLAVQPDCNALGVEAGPHGDDDGTGQGGRGRALQGQGRVRFLDAASWCRLLAAVSGRTVRPLGADRQECMFGYAAIRRCTWRRWTAARRRRWRWSRRARTCAARPTTGTVARAAKLCRWFATVRSGLSVHSGVELQECMFGCAARLRCTGRRATATQRRRWD